MAVQSTGQIRAIVLAGVHLWEESAFDNATPRPLLPVGPLPLICHVLRWLERSGIRQATICANSTSRFIRKCLGTGAAMRMDLDYYEDWTPRGPAGCARDAAQGAGADRYVVVDGTILPQADLADLLARHAQSGAAVTIAVCAEPGPLRGPSQRLVPVGIYLFEPEALASAGPIGYQDIKEVLIPRLHAAGRRIVTHLVQAPCPRVSGLGSYLAINEWLLEHLGEHSDALTDYRIVGQARVHHTASLDPGARLIGPMLIGPGSRVGKGATLVGPCMIGSECLIERGAIVCRSVAWDFCRVGRYAVVDHCVLTHQASVPQGARLYEKVHLPAPHSSHLLERLRPWWDKSATPRALQAASVSLPPTADRRPGKPARTTRKESVRVPV